MVVICALFVRETEAASGYGACWSNNTRKRSRRKDKQGTRPGLREQPGQFS